MSDYLLLFFMPLIMIGLVAFVFFMFSIGGGDWENE